VVAKFADGSEIGRALTDDVAGMVTIKPGAGYQGILLVEIHGQPDATYFEEGKNVYVPFEPGRVLRAIVPAISRNIGITPFTEAGYQLALTCQTGSGPQAVCGTSIGSGNGAIPAATAIQAANGHVTGVLNQQFPAALRVDDITRLPFIVGDATAAQAIQTTPRGRYGLANIAFSKQAAMYNPAAPAPTLLAIGQLSSDLLDGRLDGMSGSGPAAAAASRTYDPQTLTSELSAALAQQTSRYGSLDSIAVLPAVTAFGNTRYDSYYFDATLEPNGAASTIAVATEAPNGTRAPGQKTTYVDSSQRGFMLYGNMGSGALFIKTDAPDSHGSLLAVGDNSNGELGDGTEQRTGRAGPSRINLPAALTHAAGGIAHTVARLADGAVFAWGDNSYGQLGQGVGPTALVRSAQPMRVPLPAGALAVAASNQASFALLENSSVHSWGGAWGFGTLGDSTANGQRATPAPVLSTDGPLTGVVQVSVRDNDAIALKSDGSVWTWGAFSAQAPIVNGPSGIRPGNVVATRVDGIPATTGGVRKVLTEQGLFAVLVAGSDSGGADLDGAVYTWGVHFDITAGKVLWDLQPARVLNLPPVRDLMPGGFLGYGQRPSDRLTAMAIDYDGRMWKIRGRVAEQYDPAHPTVQRRPQGQAPREDCASCHVVRPKTLPPVPTTGPTCAVPALILSLLTTQSQCQNCHNDAALSSGRALGPLTCVPPALPAPLAPIPAPVQNSQCALPAGHPEIKTKASCASCHNSVAAAPLTCSADITPLQPASSTVPAIAQALDDEGVGGAIASNGITDDTTPTLVGTLSAALAAGETVNVLRDGSLIGAASATAGSTSWQFNVPALAAGSTYSFTARVDRNGASPGTASAPFLLQVSTQGPARNVQITTITDDVPPATGDVTGLFSNDVSPTISGTITPALAAGEAVRLQRSRSGEVVDIDVPAGAVGAGGTSFTFTDAGLANGFVYTYRARAIGPSGNGALGTAVSVTIDTAAPTVAPTISVSASDPAGKIAAAAGIRASGKGISDATPLITVTVNGAADNDQIEVQVSTDNGSSFVRLPGSSLTPVPASGSHSFGVTHSSGAALSVGSDTTPNATPQSVQYRARLVDRAGQVGPNGNTSNHRIGLFSCFDLKDSTAGRALSTSPPSGAAHSTVANVPMNCVSCHEQRSALGTNELVQRVPGSTTPTYRYWCTFGGSNVAF